MRLPCLYPPQGDVTAYRCLHLPSFERPSCVRLEEADGGATWRIVSKQTDGDGGLEVGSVDRQTDRALTSREVARVTRSLAGLGFWDLPTTVERCGLDGTYWVLEGVYRGKYHVAERWSPESGDPFDRFCRLLVTLAEFDNRPPSLFNKIRRRFGFLAGDRPGVARVPGLPAARCCGPAA